MDLPKGIWIFVGLFVLVVAVCGGIEWMNGRAEKVNLDGPKSVVTNWTGDPKTSIAITWHTKNAEDASIIQLVKREGEDAASFEGEQVIQVEGTHSQIEIDNGTLQGVHKVVVDGLEPGTTYQYRVGNGAADGWSDTYSFTTEAEHVEEFSFINVTDSQGVTKQDFALWGKTLDKAFEMFPDAKFIVHNGDLTEEPTMEAGWDYFFEEAKQWITSVPLMPVTGNHDEVGEDAARFVSHFQVPDNGAAEATPGTSYSFDYGPVHIVVLNTESNVKKQAKWLEEDLANTSQPWKIVAMHEGPYGGNQKESILKRWVPIFDAYGVDLVLQGHNHEYVRSYPMKNDQIVEEGEGTVYIVPNTSGPKFNVKKEDLYYHQVHFQNEKQMFAAIHISGSTLTYEAYDVDGKKLDELTLQH